MLTQAPSPAELEFWLRERLSEALGIPVERIDAGERFKSLDLSSIQATSLAAQLGDFLGLSLPVTLLWEQPTPAALARYLSGVSVRRHEPAAAPRAGGASPSARMDEPIAIIGIGCRFPGGADSPASFWQLLRDGVDAISEVPSGRWDAAAFFDQDPAAPGKMATRWGGFLREVEGFDASFFGVSPREAGAMDPQQRLVLELAWEGLEDAGLVATALRDTPTGVFLGAMWSDYTRLGQADPAAVIQHTATGVDTSIIAARVSYLLGLRGPSLVVNTACSSALVAVRLACESLRRGEVTLALAGGVHLMVSPWSTVAMTKFGAMSPSGRCRAFDAAADGYVRGEGAGIVVLKPWSQALADGDPIYALILGGAVNNDGFSNGLTAPSPQAQEEVLAAACFDAGVEPRQVRYVETHGPGTILGDPIEARALGAVLGKGRQAGERLRLGSVKTNIGHLEAAAGIAGLIKVALALHQRALPPNLHFERPNPHIAFDALGLAVQRQLEPWPGDEEAPVAGVSSFGFGGTNCHLVLRGPGRPPSVLLPVAAEGVGALHERLTDLSERVKELGRAEPSATFSPAVLAGMALSAQGRYRCALRARSMAELSDRITDRLRELGVTPPKPTASVRVVFVCSGHGSQWFGMGQTLLRTEPVFRRALVECDRAIAEVAGWSVLTALTSAARHEESERVDRVQPVIFAIQVALGALWRAWGVEPDALLGHSMGEVSAAHLAGALSLEDAARIICRRSLVLRHLPEPGAMAAVKLTGEEAERAVDGHSAVVVAAYNSPRSVLLAGPTADLAKALEELKERGVEVRPVNVDCASHGPWVEEGARRFADDLRGLRPRAARHRLYSTVSAQLLAGPECGPGYWRENLTHPVRFAQTVQEIAREGAAVFVELSPHPVLLKPIAEILAEMGEPASSSVGVPSLRRDEDERDVLLDSAGELYRRGVQFFWRALVGEGVVAEEDGDGAADRPLLLPLSANSPTVLAQLAAATREHLEQGSVALDDLIETAGARRVHQRERLAVVGRSRAELCSGLAAGERGEHSTSVARGRCGSQVPGVVFVFPGQGSQWLGMGRSLARYEPVFRQALERCDSVIRRWTDWSLLAELAAPPETSRLDRIEVVQPTLFAVQVALATLWRSWGVEPAAVVGHSMGEVAAAHVAGALELDDAARIICRRSRLLRRVSGRGAMAVVQLDAGEAVQEIAAAADRVSVAASNSPASTVLAGDVEALDVILARLEERGIFCRRVKVDVASHSPQVDPLTTDLLLELEGLDPKRAAVPIMSTVEAEFVDGSGFDAAYWMRNLREPVRFAQAIQGLINRGHNLFVEISAHPILVADVESMAGPAGGVAVGSLQREADESSALLGSLAELYCRGVLPSWSTLHHIGRLAAWPRALWQRQRYWLGSASDTTFAGGGPGHPLLGAVSVAAGTPTVRSWQFTVGPRRLPDLGDHRVRGMSSAPGALLAELALAAARDSPGGGWILGPCAFVRLMDFPGEDDRRAQMVLRQELPDEAAFEIFVEEEGDWVLCAHGKLIRADSPKEGARPNVALAGAATFDALRSRVAEPLAVDGFYRQLAAAGVELGPAWRCLRELWTNEREALARAAMPEAMEEGFAGATPPAWLDAAWQTLLAFAPDPAALLLPDGLDALRWFRTPRVGEELWIHAERLAGEPNGLSGTVRLLDADGRLVARADGLRCRQVGGALTADGLYALHWEPAALTLDNAATPAGRTGSDGGAARWWILADRGGVGEALATRLDAAGHDVVLTQAMSSGAGGELAPMHSEVAVAFPGGPPAAGGVVDLRSLDLAIGTNDWGADALAAQELGSLGTLQLIQTLAELSSLPWRLVLATSGVQDPHGIATTGSGSFAPQSGPPADASERLSAVVQAPLWGLFRTLINEHPEWRSQIVDLDPADSVSRLAQQLFDELIGDDREEQVAWRGATRYGARLVRAGSAPAAAVPAADRSFRLAVPAPGTLESLELCAMVRRTPGPGEVEIEVEAAGVGFLDVLLALGLLPEDPTAAGSNAPRSDGSRLGMECAGRICRVGEGSDLQPGDLVMAIAPGGLASHVTLRRELVARRPADWGPERAATVPVPFLTAWQSLVRVARLAPGERVLIHAATGGVGLAALQIARRCGAEIHATAGTPEKRQLLLSLGVASASDSRSLEFTEVVRQATGGAGVDIVLNALGGRFIPASLELLRSGGRFVELGKRDYLANHRLGLRPFLKGLTFSLVDLRRMALEQPATIAELFREVLPLFTAASGPGTAPCESLPYRAWPASEAREAFHHMAQARHTGRIVIGFQERPTMVRDSPEELVARPGGTYLVTGGLGGLGLELARALAEGGAGRLVLVGRGGAGSAVQAMLEELSARTGTEILVRGADVADADALAAVFSEIDADGAPLAGVIHAAGVLDDATLEQAMPDSFRRVLRPKVGGGWNLHRLTRERDLDFLVFCSSALGLIGTAGQASYCAANTFLDALARARRRCGLPAISVQWGVWRRVGLAAASAARGARLEEQGLGGFEPEDGIRALAHILRQRPAECAVLRLDWRRLRSRVPKPAAAPFFDRVAAPEAAQERVGTVDATALREVSPAERRARLEASLGTMLTRILGLSGTDELNFDTALVRQGIDSLMAVELRNRVQSDFGVAVSVIEQLRGLCARQLVDRILDNLDVTVTASQGGGDAESSRGSAPASLRAPEEIAVEEADGWEIVRL